MQGDFGEIIYWFMFILGLATFGGLVIIAYRVVRNPASERGEITRALESLRKLTIEVKEKFNSVDQKVHDLKYQHDNADDFGFGTVRVNQQLDSLMEKLIRVEILLEVLGRKDSG